MSRGFAPRTPLHAPSLAAAPARSGRVADSRALVRALTWPLAFALLATIAGCDRAPAPVTLATTTSVANSGLLDAVLPHYGGKVQPVLVGSGRAIDMLASGQADVIISHAPEREAAALQQHPRWTYRKILYNDFVIVGPPYDPAGVKGSPNAIDAMSRIARSPSVFLSRGDESGTHERERRLWGAAQARPPASRLVVAGAGMGQTLRVASSTGAYTLTDRGTFETLAPSLELVILFEGDPRLVNTYAVIVDTGRRDGAAFAEWIAGPEGRRAMAEELSSGRIKGFAVWPAGTPGDDPLALPDPR
jgi:tungstate transport system substrate-binding protein